MKMELYTIKKAAEVTGISATTIRRYIKSGKISASLQKGRYGPEYRIAKDDLKTAGFEQNSLVPARKNGNNNGRSVDDLTGILKDLVPLGLYQELAMKHEQLLVQYGMVRAGGQRLLEYKAENEMKEQTISNKQAQFESTLKKLRDEIGFLKKHLRLAELEIEEKNSRIRELRDKVNLLELLSRNAVTSESIEKQFLQIYTKQQEIRQLSDKANVSEERSQEAGARQEKPEQDH